MKNVKLFEDFGKVNEANSKFGEAVEQLWNELNKLYLLQDEGYVSDNGAPSISVDEINAYLKTQGLSDIDVTFAGSDEFQKWIDYVISLAGDLSVKWGSYDQHGNPKKPK